MSHFGSIFKFRYEFLVSLYTRHSSNTVQLFIELLTLALFRDINNFKKKKMYKFIQKKRIFLCLLHRFNFFQHHGLSICVCTLSYIFLFWKYCLVNLNNCVSAITGLNFLCIFKLFKKQFVWGQKQNWVP